MESSADGYARAFRDALAGWEQLLAPLTAEEFNRRPAPDAWSAGHCLDHVNVTAAGYLPEFERVIARGGPLGNPPFHYGLRGRLFIETTGPEPRLRFRSPRAMKPAGGPFDRDESLSRYREHAERFFRVLDAARGLDLAAVRMRSPFLPRIPLFTFPVGALFESVAGHDRRHFEQARRAVGGE